MKTDNKCIKKIIKQLWTSCLYQLFKVLPHLKPRSTLLALPVVKLNRHIVSGAISISLPRHPLKHTPHGSFPRSAEEQAQVALSMNLCSLPRGSRGLRGRERKGEGRRGWWDRGSQGKQALLPGSCWILWLFLNQVIWGSGTPVAWQSRVVELLMATVWSLRFRRRCGASWSGE